jgi:hypothetical protein
VSNTAIKAIVAVVGVGVLLALLVLARATPHSDAARHPEIEPAAADRVQAPERGARRPPIRPRFIATTEVAVTPTPAPAAAGPPMDREQCERSCGAACVAGPAGQPECPKLCATDDESESGALCLPVRANGKLGSTRRCILSECSGSAASDECGPGMACQYTGRMEGGVYRCLPVGGRTLGQTCSGNSAANLCGRGLRCVLGTCQPESCVTDTDCQKGYRCRVLAGGDNHKKCFPGCRVDGDCPPDQSCVQAGATSLCTPSKDTCLKSGCPDGLVCHIERMTTADLRTLCRPPCDPEKPDRACGPDAEAFCVRADFWNEQRNVRGVCFKRCVPGDPASCPKNQACRISQQGPRCFALPSAPAESSPSSSANPT